MKKLVGFFVCLVVCFPFVYGAQAPETGNDYYANSYARLSYVNGDVFIQRAGDLGYEEGIVNLAIVEGDKLGTREGRAEIHFGRKNYLRIDRFTQIDMIGLPKRGLDVIKLHLLSGNFYLRVNYLEREKDFEIHTPDGSFYVLQEGLYSVSVSENSETDFRVLEGMAEAAGETGSQILEAEQRIIVSNGSFLSEPTYFAGLEENFSEWNRSRDALLSRPVSTSYLPSELSDYENELADNGRWVNEREYGNVWVPSVHHDTWSPYWNGRWVWYPIIGWNWVSYDSWGWCVSHYGRWQWRLSLGWYWIPTRHWGPAWVHWYHGYDHYGWCPLSYYGYPGVILNNRYYGRYYNHYYPGHSRSFMMVHRDHFRSHRISKYALSQSARRQVGKVRLSSLQPKIRPQIDRAQMRNSPAAKVLARSDIRRVSKSYSGRLSSTKVRATSGRTIGTSPLRKSSSVNKSTITRGSSQTAIKTRTSSLSSRSGISKTARTSSSRSAIKTYPSKRSTNSRSVTSSSSKIGRSSGNSRALPKSSSRSSQGSSKIKNYSSRNYSPSSRTTKSNTRSGINSSSRLTTKSRESSLENRSSANVSRSRSSGSAISKIYRSRSSSISGSSKKSSAASSRYSAPSRSSTSSRSYSSSKSRAPSKSYSSRSSSPSRMSSSTRSYSAPSRSSSPSRVTSSRSSSPSRSRVSSSRSSSSSRSRVSSSRSSSSSRRSSGSSRTSRSSGSSRSSGKVRKK